MSIVYINRTNQKPNKMTLLLQNNFGQANSAYLPAHSQPRQTISDDDHSHNANSGPVCLQFWLHVVPRRLGIKDHTGKK